MATVNSPLRGFLKPILARLAGEQTYLWFLLFGKIRDIRGRLVEEPEMRLLPRFIKPGDHVADIGANYAYYTTRMAALCPGGRVFGFEPIPSTFWVCRKIISFFRFNNVELYELGVGERGGRLTFEVPLQAAGTPSAGQAHIGGRDNGLSGWMAHYPFKRKKLIECGVVALDSGEWRERLSRVSFIKMDIEGAELFALRGMRGLLRAQSPVVLLEICEFFLQGFSLSSGLLRQFAEESGYAFYRYDARLDRLLPHESSFEDGNYLMLPKCRLREFAAFISHPAGLE